MIYLKPNSNILTFEQTLACGLNSADISSSSFFSEAFKRQSDICLMYHHLENETNAIHQKQTMKCAGPK